MSDCLFCKIAAGQIPSSKVYEDDEILAFEDINPQAPVHILVIPKKHIATYNDISIEDSVLLGKIHFVIKKLASDKGIASDGYRVVMNCNKAGGQEVYHIHFHLLGGRSMIWPPG